MIYTRLSAGVATVEIDDLRPLSAMVPSAGRELRDTVKALSDDDSVRAIVLASRGADFCAPLDGDARVNCSEVAQAVYASATGLYQTVCYCPKVVIAAVHGQCSDAGSALLLCTNLAVMSENASLRSPFARVPCASFVLASLTMRLGRAKAWCMAEDGLGAGQALEFGLVNRVVGRAALLDEAERMARRAAQMPLDGLRISKVMLDTYLDSQGVGKEFDHAWFHAGMQRGAAEERE